MEDKTTQEAAAAEDEKPSSVLPLRKLSDYAVGSIPTVFYVPDFISQPEASQLLHHIYQAPAPTWKSLKNRRLQNWGGVVHEKGLLPQTLPSWLTKITDRICHWTGLFPSAINHVLINEYHPNQGIMLTGQECTDPGTIQSSEMQPTILESNSSTELKGANKAKPATSSLLLMPCSLLIFKDDAYTDYLHGIQDTEVHNLDKVANMPHCPEFKHLNSDYSQAKADEPVGLGQSGTFRRRCTRVSLTCRLVLKVHKKLFKI